jgi:hypothetical protein
MTKKQVNIDSVNIHLSSGWQGDPVYLARKVSEQIQLQSAQLNSCKELRLNTQGNFGGVANRVKSQLSKKLNEATAKSKGLSTGGHR